MQHNFTQIRLLRNDKLSRKTVFYDYFYCANMLTYEHTKNNYNPTNGKIIFDSLYYDSNAKGFNSLLSHLSELNSNFDFIVGFELTSHYHYTIFNYPTSKKYNFYEINHYVYDW